MKILCLHGTGSSGEIFRCQTAAIIARLAPTHPTLNFDFVDGPYECPPAREVEGYKPPYYSFYKEAKSHSESQCGDRPETEEDCLSNIRQAHAWLKHLIHEKGPYDLVVGFGQGAELAAGLLLGYEHETETQKHNIKRDAKVCDGDGAGNWKPFKAAIFICGSLPLPFLEEMGYRISEKTKQRDRVSRDELVGVSGSGSGLEKAPRDEEERLACSSPNPYLTPCTPSPLPHHNHNHSQHYNIPTALSLPFPTNHFDLHDIRTELKGAIKIRIPTVHVYGERDPMYIGGIQLAEVCESNRRKVYNHGGGHEIPSYEAVSAAVADLVRWAVRAVDLSPFE